MGMKVPPAFGISYAFKYARFAGWLQVCGGGVARGVAVRGAGLSVALY